MAKRTASELFAAARQAGLSIPAATIAVAVALAESGGDDRVLGDTTITGNGWGPSVGAWQIRTRVEQYGTGGDRDLLALQGNLARQAAAMRSISAGGTNWSPWTVYTRGTYTQFLGQAREAAGTAGTAGGLANLGVPDVGIGDTAAAALTGARNLLIKLSFAGLGVALLGVGLVVAVRSRVVDQQAKVRKLFGGGGG